MISVHLLDKIFNVPKDLLLKIPYFNYMLNNSIVLNDNIIIYRSSTGFKHVLSYIIDPLHIVPPEYYYEFDFYDVDMTHLPYIVNVSGHIYKLEKNIIEQMNYFKVHGVIRKYNVVYRSPRLYEKVLSFIIDKRCGYKAKYFDELKFYGVSYNYYNLDDDHTKLLDKIHDEFYSIKNNFEEQSEMCKKILTSIDNMDINKEELECTCCSDNYGSRCIKCYGKKECIKCYNNAGDNYEYCLNH